VIIKVFNLRLGTAILGGIMRDLLFKNLTSANHKRKIIASSEIAEKEGIRSIIRRHFVCMVKEIPSDNNFKKPLPHVHILKEHNTKECKEKFFCKIKGSICAVNNGKLFLVIFMHSLKIDLTAIPQQVS
jgi:hypothetical protein